MEVLKDVIRDDLNDEAHDLHMYNIYFKPVGPFSLYKSAIIYLKLGFWKLEINLSGLIGGNFLLREGFKKKKNIMENSITRGGSARVIFHIQFFFIFFSPNGLKIIFRH